MHTTGWKGYGGWPGAGGFALGLLLLMLLSATGGGAVDYHINGTDDFTTDQFEDLYGLIDNGAQGNITIGTGDRIILHQDDGSLPFDYTSVGLTIGGNFYVGGSIIANNLTFTSDSTTRHTITRDGVSLLSGNMNGHGGGFIQISMSGGTVTSGHTISNLILTGWHLVADTDNTAFRGGAVLLMEDTNSNTINNVAFTNNSVSTRYVTVGGGGGGAVFLGPNANGNTFTDVVFGGNTMEALTTATVASGGGALYVTDNNSNSFESVRFTGNTATVRGSDSGGGAAYLLNATGVTLKNTAFSGNTASQLTAGQIAYGGAIYAKDSTIIFSESNLFNGNTAESAGGSYGGAIYYENSLAGLTYTGVGTASTMHFEDNKAYAGSGIAAGGAIYATGAKATITGAVFSGNWAGRDPAGSSYVNVTAQGGATYFADGAVIKDSTFSGNRAIGTTSGQGGAIYADGDLDLTDVSFTGNIVAATSAADAQGGAVYATGDVKYTVSAGKTSTISGNRANSAASGFYIENSSVAGGKFEIDVGSGGLLAMLDPVNVVSTNDYTFTKTGTGDFRWDGINTFRVTGGKATISLQGGTLHLGDDFSLTALGSNNTAMDVNIAADEVTFGLGRSETLAMFDFTNANSASSSFKVLDGTKLTTELGRSVISFDKSYAVVSGLDESQIIGDFTLSTNYAEYVTVSDPLRYSSSDKTLYADIRFKSPFDTNGPNALSARDPLDEMLTGYNKVDISDAEYLDLLRNARAAYPELYLEQAHISLDSADRMSRTAIDYGLRYPHRNRGEGGEVVMGGEEYYDEYSSYRDEYAYPSLALCGPDKGLRFWTGYVGDWRNENAHSGYNGYKSDRHGVLVGANYEFSDAGALGIYGGYSHIDTKAKRVTASTKTNSAHFGVQGRLSPLDFNRDLSFYGDAAYHYYDNDMSRKVGGWDAHGGFQQDILTVGLGVEHVFRMDGYNLTPHLEARYFYLNQDDLTEGGTSVTRTRVDGFNKGSFNTRLGVEASKDYCLANGVFTPAINLSWRHEYGTKNYGSDAVFIQNAASMPFNLSSSPNDRDSLDLGLALKGVRYLSSGNRMGLNVAYNLNVSSRSSTHSVYAGLDVGF